MMNRILNSLKLWKNKTQSNRLKASEGFCMAPWVSLHMAPQGQVFPCCISAHYLDEAIGDVKEQPLEKIWNSTKMTTLRKNMMSGRKSKQCELCYQYEQVGQTSPRQDFNTEFGSQYDIVDRHTTIGGRFNKFELKYIDFRFSNLCNFRCRICSHHFSTSWFTEAVKLGTADPNGKRLVVPMENIEDIWKQIEPILPHLEHIHFAGGEPLIMEEHYRILNYFVENERFGVRLTYNTNFSETKYKGKDVMELWKLFKNVTVCASLDGMEERGELMRKGQNWAQTVENTERMIQTCPHVTFVLTPAIGVMNVLHLPDFYADWVKKKLLKPDGLNLYLVFEPEFYSIQNLPEFFKQRVRDKYGDFINTYVKKLNAGVRTKVESQFKHVLDHLDKPDKFSSGLGSFDGHTFVSYNSELDKLRSEDIVKVFPELSDLYNSSKFSE